MFIKGSLNSGFFGGEIRGGGGAVFSPHVEIFVVESLFFPFIEVFCA